jgi:outer membrane assembly lipoprotein YfiO
MPRTGGTLLILLSMTSLAPAAEMVALAPKTWERGDDAKWREVEEPAAPQVQGDPVANSELDRIERLLADGKARQAKKPLINWIKAHTDAPDRDRGLFLLAEMYDQTGDKIRAFYHLDELMDYYPGSRLFFPSLEKQFGIADRFFKGFKRKFLGIPFLSADDEAVEILFRIQERAPGSPIAERALLRTADYYYDSSQFDLSGDAYGKYVERYPRSPDVPRVRLRQAFSSLAQFRGLRFDATPVIDAKTQLQDIQAEYPEMSAEENVADVLERIEGILAARVAQTADFYRRTNEPQAAVYTWRHLIENFPETPDAARARQQLDRAPKWALDFPMPTGRASEDEQLRTPAAQPPALRDPANVPNATSPPPSTETPADETP